MTQHGGCSASHAVAELRAKNSESSTSNFATSTLGHSDCGPRVVWPPSPPSAHAAPRRALAKVVTPASALGGHRSLAVIALPLRGPNMPWPPRLFSVSVEKHTPSSLRIICTPAGELIANGSSLVMPTLVAGGARTGPVEEACPVAFEDAASAAAMSAISFARPAARTLAAATAAFDASPSTPKIGTSGGNAARSGASQSPMLVPTSRNAGPPHARPWGKRSPVVGSSVPTSSASISRPCTASDCTSMLAFASPCRRLSGSPSSFGNGDVAGAVRLRSLAAVRAACANARGTHDHRSFSHLKPVTNSLLTKSSAHAHVSMTATRACW